MLIAAEEQCSRKVSNESDGDRSVMLFDNPIFVV